jgi:hypothetical protein
MAKTYVVVGQCAHVTVDTPTGPALNLLYKGATVPDSATPQQIEHLLSVKLIAEVNDVPANEVTGDGSDAKNPVVPDADVDPDVLARRQAAAAKLASDGSAPHSNAGKDVWVEYAVVKGMDRAEAEKADKADLIAALKS